MCSPLHHLTLIQDNDLITIPDGGEAVGNDDQEMPFAFTASMIRCSVLVSRALVASSKIRMVGRWAKARAISRRCLWPQRSSCPFFNHMGVASRPSHDVFVNLGIFAGFDHGGFINGLVPQGEVVEDGVFKERYVLIHHRDGGGKNLAGNLLPGMPSKRI